MVTLTTIRGSYVLLLETFSIGAFLSNHRHRIIGRVVTIASGPGRGLSASSGSPSRYLSSPLILLTPCSEESSSHSLSSIFRTPYQLPATMSEIKNSTATAEGKTVEATAPSDLPGGYLVDVEVGGVTQQVAVPAGGVASGATFQGTLTAPTIPRGEWRDDFCGCCKVRSSMAVCYQWPLVSSLRVSRVLIFSRASVFNASVVRW